MGGCAFEVLYHVQECGHELFTFGDGGRGLAVLGSSLRMDDTSHRSSFSIFDGGSILLVVVKGALFCRFGAGAVARAV